MPISLVKTNDKSTFSTFHFQSADIAKQRLIEIAIFSARNKSFIRIVWRFGYFFITLQSTTIDSIMSTQAMTQTIAEYFKTQPVLKAWLFGSFARGEQRPDSDIDLLVQLDKTARVSLMKHAGMIVDLEERLNCPVDLVIDGTLLPFARESAERDKKLIYERAN